MRKETEDQERARVEKLFQHHRERLDQIEGYWRSGGLTNDQATRLLEGTPLKQEPKRSQKG